MHSRERGSRSDGMTFAVTHYGEQLAQSSPTSSEGRAAKNGCDVAERRRSVIDPAAVGWGLVEFWLVAFFGSRGLGVATDRSIQTPAS